MEIQNKPEETRGMDNNNMETHRDKNDTMISVHEAFMMCPVKYEVRYQSVVPSLENKIISKEKLDEYKDIAVQKNFPFTRKQIFFI